MTAVPARPPPLRPLRILIDTADPLRRIGLASILTGYGHEVVESDREADVVVAETGEADGAQIDAAIRAVAAGLVVRAAARPGFTAMPDDGAPLLTPREVEVLVAMGNGLSNKAMARRFGISPHTVKFHVESLFRKLGAANRAEAVAKGLKGQAVQL